MCKFYRIASNSLQAIQIVHERFYCPSYNEKMVFPASSFIFDRTIIKVAGTQDRH